MSKSKQRISMPKNRSKANALGLGGYHIITRVTNQLAPGNFSTKVEAQFHYSGDGLSDQQRLGFFEKTEERPIEQNARISARCRTILDDLEETTGQIGASGIEQAKNQYGFTATNNAKAEGWEKSEEAYNDFYENVDLENARISGNTEFVENEETGEVEEVYKDPAFNDDGQFDYGNVGLEDDLSPEELDEEDEE